MDKQEQRITIAEACGYTNIKPRKINGEIKGFTSDQGLIPDYLNDLNAMHDAERVLTYKQGGEMTLWIQRMTCSGYGPQLFATAAQRAEAFLKTLNLWKD